MRLGAAAPGGEPYEQLGALYDRWCAGVDHDIAYYVLACEGAEGPIVELGAGSGRIAVELARHGHRVIALDAAPAMLAAAELRARRYGVEQLLDAVVGDLREPPDLPSSDRVIAPFRTFMHLTGDDERRRALAAAGALLAPDGRFIFDVFEPTAVDIRATHDRWIARREGISEHPLWDPEARRLALTVRLSDRAIRMTLEWRTAEEWRKLCEQAGLTVISAEAGFEGEPLTHQKGDQVFVCTRNTEPTDPVSELGVLIPRRASRPTRRGQATDPAQEYRGGRPGGAARATAQAPRGLTPAPPPEPATHEAASENERQLLPYRRSS